MKTSADKAFFGEKDYQQLQIVRRMAMDLDIPIEVVGCPTIREMDGLAMSSRNLLISDRARVKAPALAEVMNELREALLAGGRMSDLLEDAKAKILTAGFNEVDALLRYLCTGETVEKPDIRPGWYLRSLTEKFVPDEAAS